MDDPKEGSSARAHAVSWAYRARRIDQARGRRQADAARFTFIDDAVVCLTKIIDNPGGIADGKIYNIGNPHILTRSASSRR